MECVKGPGNWRINLTRGIGSLGWHARVTRIVHPAGERDARGKVLPVSEPFGEAADASDTWRRVQPGPFWHGSAQHVGAGVRWGETPRGGSCALGTLLGDSWSPVGGILVWILICPDIQVQLKKRYVVRYLYRTTRSPLKLALALSTLPSSLVEALGFFLLRSGASGAPGDLLDTQLRAAGARRRACGQRCQN